MIRTIIFSEKHDKYRILEKKMNDFFRITNAEDVITVKQSATNDKIFITVMYIDVDDRHPVKNTSSVKLK